MFSWTLNMILNFSDLNLENVIITMQKYYIGLTFTVIMNINVLPETVMIHFNERCCNPTPLGINWLVDANVKSIDLEMSQDTVRH